MSTLLLLGTLDADWLRTTLAASAAASLEPQLAPNWQAVAPGSIAGIRAVVLGHLPDGPHRSAERLRQDERLEHVAILEAGALPTASAYVDALTSGIDDLLTDPGDELGVRLRLRAAREAGAGSPSALRRGLAWCLGKAGIRSGARARALRAAGFRATVETETTDAPWLREPRLALVVWETDDAGLALRQVRAAREAGVLCRFVLCVPDEQAAQLGGECEKLDGVRALPEGAPPDSVVFLVNEMAESTVRNQRASRRRLASAFVRFRGADRAGVGLSYNVSAGGLYIRTLAPISSGRIQLSVELPGGSVANAGCEVVWSRALYYDGTATVPPGFGVKILEASEASRGALASLGAG